MATVHSFSIPFLVMNVLFRNVNAISSANIKTRVIFNIFINKNVPHHSFAPLINFRRFYLEILKDETQPSGPYNDYIHFIFLFIFS